MITFKSVEYKNFLSTGNVPNTIYLNRVPSALITGTNGAGKSTILDAICYGLFGKPYRNINKPQLLNSVNEKALLVTIEFEINNIEYRVNRGLKPAVFEIYKNNKLVPHDAAIKDYQQKLEDILGINYKAFTQIVILGSARYQSFMDLSSNDRRTIIEEILDITVFSKMNSILKTRNQNNELDIKENDYQKEINKTKISSQKGLIKNITKRSQESAEKINKEIKRTKEELDVIESEYEGLVEKDLKALHDKSKDIEIKAHELSRRRKMNEDRVLFYQNASHCTECEQEIPQHLKEDKIAIANHDMEKIDKLIPMAKDASESIKKDIEEAQAINTKMGVLKSQKTQAKLHLKKLEESIQLEADTDSLELAREELESHELEANKLGRESISLVELKHTYEVCKILLKDDGIKAKIIKQYLPLINKLINKHLDKMGANYSFHLDESFNEIIKSRYRDSFSYASFSEGEKMRIDLALMFTWREIAKVKNSINTNLLIMDEVGDSSLDAEATDVLWELIGDLENTNVFVISHKSHNGDKFRSLIEFTKSGNFSKIVDSKSTIKE